MLKVGVLGAGMMGATHARAYAKRSDVQIIGISSGTAAKAATLAKEVGAQPFADALALATHPDVEAISVTLPSHLHSEYTLAALDAGKHVLLEKPMALTLDACDTMIAAAEHNGRLLMIAHVLRFWPEYVTLADIIKSGELGTPLAATATRLCTRPAWGEWLMHPKRTGGALLDLHIHDLDACNWLFGTPQRVFAQGQRGTSGWDQVLTSVDYGTVKACAEGSMLLPQTYPFTMTLRVVCERGTAEFSLRAAGEQVDSIGSGSQLVIYDQDGTPRTLTPAGDAYDLQIAAFVEHIRTGQAPIQGTVAQGRLAVQTALAARESLETGQVVSLVG